jgi:hypothetical protein
LIAFLVRLVDGEVGAGGEVAGGEVGAGGEGAGGGVWGMVEVLAVLRRLAVRLGAWHCLGACIGGTYSSIDNGAYQLVQQ